MLDMDFDKLILYKFVNVSHNGLDIKRNKAGLFTIKSTISDEIIGEDMSEDQLKKLLIERAYFKFIEETIRIGLEFPSGYYINDERQIIDDKHNLGNRFMLDNWNDSDVIENKYKEIIDKLKIEL